MTQQVAKNHKKLRISPTQGFLVFGESAGADLAMVVAHLYREEVQKGQPPLTGIYASLFSAMSSETVPGKYKDHFMSMEQNAKAPMFAAESVEFIHSNDPLSFSSWVTQLIPPKSTTGQTSPVRLLPPFSLATTASPRPTSNLAGGIR